MDTTDFFVGQMIYSRSVIVTNQCWFECSCDSECNDYCDCDSDRCNDCGCDDIRTTCWKDWD